MENHTGLGGNEAITDGERVVQRFESEILPLLNELDAEQLKGVLKFVFIYITQIADENEMVRTFKSAWAFVKMR